MNELLQNHGCANVFSIPEGLKELMADISREVLRDQPPKTFDYIANYLSVLLITREHGIMAVKILDDLCDCRASVSEHLLQLGLEKQKAAELSAIIKEEVEGFEPAEGKETIKETQILKKVLKRAALDEELAADVCQVARNAYRDYWYRKKMMEKELKVASDEPWEIAAERTLELYKRTKPSYSELTRATQKIQAAYRGYYVRRNLLRHLTPKAKKNPKVALPGPPLDVADSIEIDLGPVVNLRVRDEDAAAVFEDVAGEHLNLGYDPMRAITHVEDETGEGETKSAKSSQFKMRKRSSMAESKALVPEDVLAHRRGRAVSLFEEPESPPSRAASQQSTATADPSLHKISFAEGSLETFDAAEILEEIPIIVTSTAVGESDAAEVPEEITDYTLTAASVPSSEHETAESTDVEDVGDTAESIGEEEG